MFLVSFDFLKLKYVGKAAIIKGTIVAIIVTVSLDEADAIGKLMSSKTKNITEKVRKGARKTE